MNLQLQFALQKAKSYRSILARLVAKGCSAVNSDYYREMAARLDTQTQRIAEIEAKIKEGK